MIYGRDVSHHNDLNKIETCLQRDNISFLWIKTTEGTNFVDGQMIRNYKLAQKYNAIPGFYHYARPEKNEADAEALFFYNTISPYLNEGCMLALDWEGKALKYSGEWIKKFCKTLEEFVTGKCVIYISAANFAAYKHAFNNNGLWLAHWGADYSGYPYKNDYLIAFHQTGLANGLDADVFFGDIYQLKKYLCFEKKETRKFMVSPSDLKNYSMKKRPYLLTTDSNVKYGEMVACSSDGNEVKINVTDIAHFTISTGDLYIVTGE